MVGRSQDGATATGIAARLIAGVKGLTEAAPWRARSANDKAPAALRTDPPEAANGDAATPREPAPHEPAKDARSAADPILLPLTVAQRGIWIGAKVSEATAVFNIAEAIEIRGAVDEARFVAALWRVTEEADTTRANVIEDGEGPKQIIHPRYRGDVPVFDYSDRADPRGDAFAYMNAELTRRPAMDRDPLWFSALIKLSSDRYIWYHRAHHIILDGFSGGLIARRVAEIYTAETNGETPPPSPFDSVSNLVDLERDYRDSAQFEKDRAYWRDRSQDFPEPASFAQGRWPTDSGLLRKTVTLGETQSTRLKTLAGELKCSGPQLLIALAVAFIHRTTGADDLVLGLPVAARTKKMRKIPGMVANASIMRYGMAATPDLASLTRAVAKETRNAIRHQQYRYEDLRRDLGLTGRHRHVARLAINIEPFDYDLRFGGHGTMIHNLSNSSPGDLIFFIYDRDDGNGLRIDLDANPSLYSDLEMERHAERLRTVIDLLADDPSAPLSEIDLVMDDERRLMLEDWQGPQRELACDTVLAPFAERVAAAPDHVAVVAGATTLSYGALDRQANAVAQSLAVAGVRSGDRVGVVLPRNERTAVGFLGVLKAGATILPLDPKAPIDRLQMILDDAAPAAILSDPDLSAALPELSTPIVPMLGADATSASAPDVAIDPDAAAYVIYTSGSTGRPNGVAVSHRNVANLASATADVFGLTSESRFLAVAPYTFDPFMMELFASLAVGARVIIPPMDEIRDPSAISRLIRSEGVTTLAGSTALWTAIIERREAFLTGLTAGVGGDKLSQRLARSLADLGADVINLYGPTEATVQATAHRIAASVAEAPPIGRPLLNQRAYVLDGAQNLLPIGVAGELCIGGAGVALGYLDRPELTDKRFVADPFGRPGDRLFRTGDLARWRHDGVLEFIGRTDDQVKIRGFRVELGDVESALERVEGVDEALALVWEDEIRQAGKKLVAYVTQAEDAKLDEPQVREAVSSILPEYMAPSRIIVLDEFPMTRNGKIDRSALPPPVAQSVSAYVAPSTETERKLVKIIADTLEIDRVGVEDSLFELGCDSLTAVQLLVEIETAFSTQLSLFALLEKPTISNLAQQIENSEDVDPFAPVFSFRSQATGLPLFCVHPLIGVSWVYANLLRFIGTETPLYGLQGDGLDGETAPPASVEEMAARYVARIKEIQHDGPYHLLGWSFGGLVTHEMAAQLEAAGDEIASLTLLDAFPFKNGLAAKTGVNNLWIKSAQAYLGVDKDFNLDPETTDADAVVEKIFGDYDLTATPIMRKARLDDRAIQAAVLKVVGNNLSLIERHRPKPISADMVVYRATADKTDMVSTMIDHQPGAWRKHTAGRVDEIDLDVDHYGIMNVDSLREIGRRLARQLAGADQYDDA